MSLILGIDPGSRITGYGIINVTIEKIDYVGSGCIRLTEKEHPDRLQSLFSNLSSIIQEYKPESAAIEQVFMHVNPGGALKLGQARGCAIVAATQYAIPVSEYSARQVKQAVAGYGAAKKEQIQLMICELLKLNKKPQADAADALAIAICHAHVNNQSSWNQQTQWRQGRRR